MKQETNKWLKNLLMGASLVFVAIFFSLLIFQSLTFKINNPLVFDAPLVIAAVFQVGRFAIDLFDKSNT